MNISKYSPCKKIHFLFKTFIITAILSICFLIVAGCSLENSGANINVKFIGEHVNCDCPTKVKEGEEINLNLDIEYDRNPNTSWKNIPDPQKNPSLYPEGELTYPITEYELLIENIHVYINGQDCRDAFTWKYQNNKINTLNIKKEYVNNDIEIKAIGTPRTATLTLYGMEVEDELRRQLDAGTLKFEFKTPYQNSGMQLIRTLSNGLAFPIYEDDDIDVTITSTDTKGLPKNLWFRNCSRYTNINEDFYREYSNDGNTVHFYIPHYVVRDHSSIRVKEDE